MKKWALATLAGTTLMALGAIWIYRSSLPLSSVNFLSSHKKPKHGLRHLGIIMDGNRRWAKAQGKQPWKGHQGGIEPVKQTVEFCIDHQISHLSLYTFSLENFNRPQQELDELFATVERGLTNQEFTKLTEHGVRVQFIGDRSRFPERLKKTIESIEQKTKKGNKLILNLLFCYGGQQELTAAMQEIGEKIAAGKLAPNEITANLIQQHLWTHDTPPVDLVIRTSGVQRLSNFLLWQSAYSELQFMSKYWPEVTKEDLQEALQNFEATKRNFGT